MFRKLWIFYLSIWKVFRDFNLSLCLFQASCCLLLNDSSFHTFFIFVSFSGRCLSVHFQALDISLQGI
ncbi:hypothetical protein XENTR_v10021763 [Xenopus tropicalis]|nr:hypothetical protein XENTR_v10021763 [Xenopus tropicalis]